jgi:hypothetical protein
MGVDDSQMFSLGENLDCFPPVASVAVVITGIRLHRSARRKARSFPP